MEHPTTSGQTSPADERLDSWKEIAAYLKRSVRGVQRWEAEEGMPVHRHRHEKRGTVFAFKAELDAWWRERGALLAEENGVEETEPQAAESGAEEVARESAFPLPKRSPKVMWVAAGFATAVLAGGVFAWVSRNGSGASAGSLRPLPFHARDWVLVASFENRTGEPLFDGMVEYALEREIAESRYLNVVPRQRVMSVLQLMRKPLDTLVDATLGREICIRDGGIRALLTGRIEKPGSNYLLSLTLVDPNSGAVVSSFAEKAAGRSRIPEIMRRSSHRVREILGEAPALIRQSEGKLASVTTPSLTALQLYSKADALIAQGKYGAAEELLKQAVAEDPRFASAFIHLAWAIRDQGNRPREHWGPPAERAFELSAGTSERERLFIGGSYYQMTGQFEKAKASYEALMSLYPDHYWASNNLVVTLHSLRQPAASADFAARVADLNPRDFYKNFMAALTLISESREAASESYRLRAESLVSAETIRSSPGVVPYHLAPKLRFFPIYGLWLRGDVKKAFETLSRHATLKESLHSDVAASEIGKFYLLLGRLRDSEQWYRRVGDAMSRESHLALASFDRGDRKAMGRYLLRVNDAPGNRLLLIPGLLVRAGLVSEAERQNAAMEQLGLSSPATHDVMRGEIALKHGRREEGIALLRRGLLQSNTASAVSLMGSESLAGALEQEGKLAEAVEVLERLSESKVRAAVLYGWDNGIRWMRTRLQLAGLYRRMGRAGDARIIEDEVRQLLAYADPDHVLVRELNRSESAPKILAKAR